jgi:hypothetical protein
MDTAETVSLSCTSFDDGDRQLLLEWMATLIRLCGQRARSILKRAITGMTKILVRSSERLRTLC